MTPQPAAIYNVKYFKYKTDITPQVIDNNQSDFHILVITFIDPLLIYIFNNTNLRLSVLVASDTVTAVP